MSINRTNLQGTLWHSTKFSQSSSFKHVNTVLKEFHLVTYHTWSFRCWKWRKVVSKQVQYAYWPYKEELFIRKPHPLLNSLWKQPRHCKCTKCTDLTVWHKLWLVCATTAMCFDAVRQRQWSLRGHDSTANGSSLFSCIQTVHHNCLLTSG